MGDPMDRPARGDGGAGAGDRRPPRPVARRAARTALVAVALAGASAVGATLTLSKTADLRFGTMVPGATSGTVTISTDGARSCAGGVSCLSPETGAAAGFDVSGDALTNYSIMLPESTTLTDGETHSMTVDGFADSLGGTGATDATGADAFSVGATLHVSAGQVPGDYQGHFDVMVEYQ